MEDRQKKNKRRKERFPPLTTHQFSSPSSSSASFLSWWLPLPRPFYPYSYPSPPFRYNEIRGRGNFYMGWRNYENVHAFPPSSRISESFLCRYRDERRNRGDDSWFAFLRDILQILIKRNRYVCVLFKINEYFYFC